MDPVTAYSIASSSLKCAKTAWDLGETLYKFVQDTRKISETVKSLAAEVSALGAVCNLVHDELATIVGDGKEARSRPPYDKDGRLWRSLHGELGGCVGTMAKLQVIVDSVEKEGNVFRQTHRQVRLSWKKEDIEGIRRDVQIHTQNLQIALQMLNMYASGKIAHLAPRYANQDLGLKIDTLQSAVQKLEARLSAGDEANVTVANVEAMIRCAKEVLSSGATLYESSIADGSIRGERAAAKSNARVAEWAGAVESLRRDAEALELSDLTSNASCVFNSNDTKTFTRAATSVSGGVELGGADEVAIDAEDWDDDLAIALAQSAWREGGDAFAKAQWLEAEGFFKELLNDLKQLPPSQRGFCDTLELEYRFAACAYHTRDPTVATEALVNVAARVPTSDTDRRRTCDAGHLLSQLYLKRGSPESLQLARSLARGSSAKIMSATLSHWLSWSTFTVCWAI